MRLLLQLLLATALFAGLNCSRGDTEVEVSSPEAEVLESNFYGIEDPEREAEDTEDDTVSTTSMPSRRAGGRGRWNGRRHGHRGSHSHHNNSRTWSRHRNYTDEEKLNHVCQFLLSPRNRSESRHMSEKMSRLEPAVRDQITTVLANRKAAMLECCNMVEAERLMCATNYHKARYNSVCNNEEPLCVWSLMKGTTSQSTATVDRCCAFQDDERVNCFVAARNSFQRNRWQKKKHFRI